MGRRPLNRKFGKRRNSIPVYKELPAPEHLCGSAGSRPFGRALADGPYSGRREL